MLLFLCKYIYIYAFSRCFYPKRLTVHSGYTFYCQYVCSLWIEPTTFVLLMQCSTTEPQEHKKYKLHNGCWHEEWKLALINAVADVYLKLASWPSSPNRLNTNPVSLISPLQQESRTDALVRLESVPIPVSLTTQLLKEQTVKLALVTHTSVSEQVS